MSSEWIETDGVTCPVGLNVVVEFERREGSVQTARAGLYYSERDCFNSWKHNGGNCDIVRYRIVQS